MKTKKIKSEKLKSPLSVIENRIRTAFGSEISKIILLGLYA